ncbi:hypothetical protein NHQ30_001599 [Ciborinia camelliae]|nr:hypothetical protein NHQ30_001599 [Ciborinia camelliae]
MEVPKEEVNVSNTLDLASKENTSDDVIPANVSLQKELTLHPNDLDGEETIYPHGLKLAVILAALCLAVFLVALDQTIIATAIPKITDQFNSIQDIGWYGSAYLLTTTALQPTCFYVNLPIGVIAITVIAIYLKIHRANNPENLSILTRIQKLDLIGTAILIPAVICLLLALQWGGTTYPWKSSKIIGLLVGSTLLFILFIASQIILGDKGILPPRFFKDRNTLLAYVFSFLFGAGFFALIFYLAIYFQSVKGASATKAGIELLPLLISTVISSIVTGALITAIGYYTPVMIFCMILFAVGSGLITTFSLTTPISKWFGYQVITGIGIGVGFQGGVLVVQTVLPLVDVPVGTACVSFFQSLGGALFISVCQTLFQNGLKSGIEENAPQLDPQAFLHSGATEIRQLLAQLHQEEALNVVLQAYVTGLTHCYWVTTACAIGSFVAACGLDWKSVKKGHGQEKQREKSEMVDRGSGRETAQTEGM